MLALCSAIHVGFTLPPPEPGRRAALVGAASALSLGVPLVPVGDAPGKATPTVKLPQYKNDPNKGTCNWRSADKTGAKSSCVKTQVLEPYNVRLAQAFNGDFTDPAHPQGYRRVLVTGFGDVEIKGSDEQRFCGGPNDTSNTCANFKEFTLTGTMAKDGKSLTIDFSPKGGPTDLLAKKVFKNGVTGHEHLDAAELEFPDGNVWSKVYYGPMTQRLLDAHGPI
ncbi:hypothetical protein EMIHUDRAFT_234445 [Emiliania huxleyi CCMP1516]|uniref:Uncharacterized protein n=2 Tax=Emiliania huxleyi TaxID=2903 RepID=A0A0D3JZH8_EMIH1|nr:hypothetical protein EMIHUDRAFT_234445 [Emiliania huxleyi CCMP1516]EOD28913.1 hypothetical protein EMIHUDRAFT_234445 [Emiliania huxleyi CCMP1516]|eukprot:XP_005781342.1 hypothetical protein EMIHUDRAFT_234445 [Emiliania huxleyi CCMP1516]